MSSLHRNQKRLTLKKLMKFDYYYIHSQININQQSKFKKIMIVPYYNCLLIGYRYNELVIDEEGEYLIKDYLEQYLTSSNHTEIKIILKCCGLRNVNIINRMTNIMHMLLTNLSIPVYQVNNTYTVQEKTNRYFQALSNLIVREEQSHNKPAIIENIALLKDYHSTYDSENATKQFLKQLLIKEINHQRRCIVYRKHNQITALIHGKIGSIKGNIQIIEQFDPTQSNKCSQLFIVLLNQKGKSTPKLQQLITMLKNEFTVNQTVNCLITSNYTLKSLKKNAVNKFQLLAISYYSDRAKEKAAEISSLRQIMITVGNLKAVLKEGCRLVEQDKKLQQQFLKFVAEMNTKYTQEISKYFMSFNQHNQYIREKHLYYQKKKQQQKIRQYLKGRMGQVIFFKMQSTKRNMQCAIIQNSIRGFMIRKRQLNNIMDKYIQQKRRINLQYREQYANIKKCQNEQQIKKLQTFNRFKYGFSCCIYIIDISNKTNCQHLQPSKLSKLFQKINKTHQLLARIKCSQYSIQVDTIEGRSFRKGSENGKENNKFQLASNKSNNNQITNRSYQSIIHQFDSQSCKNTQIQSQHSSRISLSKQRQVFQEKCLYIKGFNYQFKLMLSGKLYGNGDNKYGQLGIQHSPFVSQYILILPDEKVKIVATGHYHTIIITVSNKIFYCGKSKGRLIGSKVPIEINFNQKILVKQVVIAHNDVYFLTESNKIYSLQSHKTLRLPKQIEMSFDNFHIVRTGGLNMQISYLLAYSINSLDLVKRQQVEKYLLESSIKAEKICSQSILVGNNQRQALKQIHQLSSICEQSSF